MDDGRNRMGERERRLLCALADPQAEPLSLEMFAGVDVGTILHAARDHNVEPVVLRKMAAMGGFEDPGDEELRRMAAKDKMYLSAITLALEEHAGRIDAAMAERNVPHAIVKGRAFARDLYAERADRPFSDIDILVPKHAMPQAMDVLATLEFEQFTRRHFDKSEVNEEQKWGFRGDGLFLAELHTNLVHVPSLRRRVSLGFEEFDLAAGGGARPVAGHFAVAVVHAGAGHKFHQLRLLVDVLQAARRLSDDDLGHLADVMDRLRIQPEVAMALALIADLFPDAGFSDRVGEIREALRLPACWTPVTGRAVLDAVGDGYWSSKLRRHAYRYYQMTLAPRKGGAAPQAATR